MDSISIQCRHDRSYRFTQAISALLVIDLQREFFTDEAGECVEDMRSILPRVAKMLTCARNLGIRVIHTRESYQADMSDVLACRQSLGYLGEPASPGPLLHCR